MISFLRAEKNVMSACHMSKSYDRNIISFTKMAVRCKAGDCSKWAVSCRYLDTLDKNLIYGYCKDHKQRVVSYSEYYCPPFRTITCERDSCNAATPAHWRKYGRMLCEACYDECARIEEKVWEK